MRIGIIGAGLVGGTLALRLHALGHEIKVANSRGPATLRQLAEESGARAVTAAEAVRDVDVVFISIPEVRVPELTRQLFAEVPPHVVVVDTGNYFPRERDGFIEEIEAGMTESAWVARRIGRPVVKAFNNIGARALRERGRERGSPNRIALPVAGDRRADKSLVLRLADELGFDGVDAGTLEDSWRQQPGTPVFATDLNADGVRHALTVASAMRRPAFRGTRQRDGPTPSTRAG